MRTLRVASAAVLLVFMFLGLVQPAFAASATHYTVRIEDATIDWLYSLESFCPEVPEGVTISPDDNGSDRVKQANLQEMPDGSMHLVIHDLVTGTASDNLGNSYQFVYQNVSTYFFDGSTVQMKMLDTFRLKGGEVNYTVGFNWNWAYETDHFGVAVVIEDGQTVDLSADPLIFATDDGVTESPSIVPGSWQQVNTRGEALNCDPL